MDSDNDAPRPAPGHTTAADAHLAEYCREIEAYLCRKNDGHLIRVTGPSFDLVSGWARDGVPLKVAFGGIDRYFERYYRQGPRRRPVRIDFCEADVLDVFDEWRRATGLTAAAAAGEPAAQTRRSASLPEHLERVLIRLTSVRAMGTLGADVDPLIEQLSSELDRARATAGGIRGDARRQLTERLAAADAALLSMARLRIDPIVLDAMGHDVDRMIEGVADQMAAGARERARERGLDQLVRERLQLPTITFS